MAKKTSTTVVPTSATTDTTLAAKKATKAKVSKIPKTSKVALLPQDAPVVDAVVTAADPADEVPTDPKKRNMTAVSTDFVSHVHTQLSEELAAKLKQKDVKELCEAFVKALVDDVKDGKAVSFTNNMSFRRKLRGARTYKNLKTGDPMKKEQHYVISMEVKPALKRVIETLPVVPEPEKKPKVVKKKGGEAEGAEAGVDDQVAV